MGLPARLNPENAEINYNGQGISLKQFPPKLRKLAIHILQSEKIITIKQAAKEIGSNYTSIRTLINRSAREGNNFHEFIAEIADSHLKENLLSVDKSLLNGAVSGSVNHQKLYYQRIGKLSDTTQINIGTLTVGVNVSALTIEDTRDRGVIDVEPFIPKGS